MKKHVSGIMLFALIVGTAVFVSAVFNEVPQSKQEFKFSYEISKRSCWKNLNQTSDNGKVSVKIVQAALNEKTGQVYTDFFIERETPSTQSVRVTLNFVSIEEKKYGNREGVVRKESVILTPDFNVDNKATVSMVSSYKWLDDMKSPKNLYVSADYSNGYKNGVSQNINSETIPVLLMKDNK